MRPLYLEIEGINSYAKKQTIDFEHLSKNKLFGIFGEVGSGKSTILDAIILALYGKIPRYGSGKQSFINLGLDSANVLFRFSVFNNTKTEVYEISRSFKRSSAAMDNDANAGTNSYKVSFMKIDDKNYLDIADTKTDVDNAVEKLLGIGLSDFTRSIVLPQGQFSEFLVLSGTPQIDMLANIFSLNDYGDNLNAKVSEKEKLNASNLSLTKARIVGLGLLTDEDFAKLEKQIKEHEKSIEELNINLEKKDKTFKNKQALSEQIAELNKHKEKYELLKLDEDKYKNYKVQIEKNTYALELKKIKDEINDIEPKVKSSSTKLEENEKSRSQIEEELKKIEKILTKLRAENEHEMPLFIKEKQDNEDIINKLRENYAKYKKYFLNKSEFEKTKIDLKSDEIDEKNINELIKKIDSKFDEIDNKKQNLRNIITKRVLIEKGYKLENDISLNNKQIKELKESIEHKQDEVTNWKKDEEKYNMENINLKIKIENEKVNKKTLLENSLSNDEINNKKTKDFYEKRESFNKIFSNKQLINTKENEKSELHEQEEKEKEQFNSLEKQEKLQEGKITICKEKTALNEKHKSLNILVENFDDKEPCPLCGSHEHPRLAEINTDIEQNKNDLELLQAEAQKIELKKLNSEHNLGNIKNALQSLTNDIIPLKEFINANKHLEDFEENELELFNEKVRIHKDKIKSLDEKIESLNKRFSEIDKKIIGVNSDIKNKKTDVGNESTKKEILVNQTIEFNENLKNLKSSSMIESFLAEKEALNQADKDFSEIEKEEEKLNLEKKLTNAKKEKIKNDIVAKEIELSRIKESLTNLKNEIIDFEAKLNENALVKSKLNESLAKKDELFFNELKNAESKYSSLSEILKGNISTIIEKEEKYASDIKKYNDEIKENNDCLSRLKLLIDKENRQNIALKEKRINLEKNFDESFVKSSFDDKNDFEKFLLEDVQKLKNELEDFNDIFTKTKNLLQNLKEKIGEQSVDNEKLTALGIELKQDKEELNSKRVDLGIKKDKHKDEIVKKENNKKMLDELKSLTRKDNWLKELKKVFEGKKFVSFIYREAMQNVTYEASKRLKSLTKGRYAIELLSDASNNAFVLRDDFSEGKKRSVKSLSGGEKFLVSLSLSLALSSQLQAKKSMPFEFFFIDEGFGALDPESLELVISALEELQKDELIIGLISHNPDLQERIENKLIVSFDKENMDGSTIERFF